MLIELPENVKQVCEILHNNGYEARIVGGAVRDAIMGKIPKDYDITTNALPEQVKKTYQENNGYILDINGADKHGVTFINFNNERFEIATYRGDGSYNDKRHCDVYFGVSLKEDLARRDFTINAMAYDPFNDVIYDFFEGKDDLKNELIKTVGNPDERFKEDALRILRAYRFAAQLGFEIKEKTKEACKNNALLLNFVSKERQFEEISKILMSDHPEILKTMHEDGILKEVLPDFDRTFDCSQKNKHHYLDIAEHTIEVIKNINKTLELRWAALLHDIGKPDVKTRGEDGYDHFYNHPEVSKDYTEQILENFKCSRKFINEVSDIVLEHDRRMPSKKTIRKFLSIYDNDLLEKHFKLREADIKGQSEAFREQLLSELNDTRSLYKEMFSEEKTDYKMKNIAINGQDLLDIGFSQGKELGDMLKYLQEKVIDNPEFNNKEKLVEFAKEKQDKDFNELQSIEMTRK